VIAKSFSRIFFRNAINNGLPVIELRDGIDRIKKDDSVKIDFEAGIVIHEGNEYHFPAIPHVRKELGKG